MEEYGRKRTGKGNRRRLAIAAGGGCALLLLIYIGVSIYFTSHFLMHTKINGQDFSGKTVAEANDFFKDKAGKYALTIRDIYGEEETISGKDISLKYKESKELGNLLKKQNGFSWPAAFFKRNDAKAALNLSYDEEKLKEKVAALNIIAAGEVPVQSAHPQFDGSQYVVCPETYGTAVTAEELEKKVTAVITKLLPEMDLEKEGCYETPKYFSDSREVGQACEEMNEYCKASVTYTMDVPVVIDAAVISTWLTVDDNMKVVLSEDAVRAWLESFGDKYDTQGGSRTFTTPNGKSTQVTGGTYGWSINEDAEFETIMNALNNKETVTKEPEYYINGTAASHGMPDWGNTYAEVDLSQQHMWYVVDGAVVLETDVITGEPIPEKVTPEGVYTILEKALDEVLVGEKDASTGVPEYETRVDYWMRITWEGVGFHDASWQGAFGGSLNQTPGIGSHGCVNMPPDKAAALYDMIEVGTPVVIHY